MTRLYERRPSAEIFPDLDEVFAAEELRRRAAATAFGVPAAATAFGAGRQTNETLDRMNAMKLWGVGEDGVAQDAAKGGSKDGAADDDEDATDDGDGPMRRPLAEKLDRLLYWTIGQLAITGKGFLAGGKKGKITLIGKYVSRTQISMLGQG